MVKVKPLEVFIGSILLSKKKVSIKNSINYCFFCGKELNNLDDKIIHRINQKKGITRNNIVILCPTCKYKFSLGKFKIFLVEIEKKILNKYFNNQNKNYKKIILKALQYQGDNYGKK